MIRITADMFSGRENPVLEVERDEANALIQEISRNQEGVAALDEGYQGLGYRGLVVESLADNIASKYGVPSIFRLAHAGNAKGLEIGDRIAAAMLKARVVDESLHKLLVEQLHALGKASSGEITETDQEPTAPAQTEAGTTASAVCQIELGAFNPGFWNAPAHIGRNNCYNYASNRRTDTFAQPGRATGHQASVMACANVTAGAISDGLHHRYNCFPPSGNPRWLMALVVAPGYDYHWYRKQKEGFWGHKPGGTAAKNVDNNGQIVWNPETAARAPYTNFCGYFYACKSQKIT